LGLGYALCFVAGCNDHGLKEVQLNSDTEVPREIEIEANRDVDVLFVIDNSGSMGDEQGKLAENFDAFIGVLERDDVNANYRIGVTTTDNGNAECSGTSPEGGSLRLSSCTTRQDEFIWPKSNPIVDAYQVACADVCPAEIGDVLGVTPTATANDPELRPRPWIERTEGLSNIEGATTTQAFACMGPQGVDGCGFEAQLESMYKAISRAKTIGEHQYDFLRDQAILAVVHVTDEADCSANEAHQALVFDRNLPEADRVFWEDPTAPVPSSAVCWNAGVKCTGGVGGMYEDCRSQDYAVNGSEIDDGATAASDAVLRPLSRYTNVLQQIEDDKQQTSTGSDVIVAVLGGVPQGYAEQTNDLVYQDAADVAVQQQYGIDYGCTSNAGGGDPQTAVPPVRLREFAEAFTTGDERNLFSICANDYAPALEAVAAAIDRQVSPGCFESCVRDTDPATPDVLDYECRVEQTDGLTGAKRELPECESGQLPDGEAACFVAKTGTDRDPECVEAGHNLEFDIVRDPTKPAVGGTKVSATCQLEPFRDIVCIPGT